MKFCSHNVRNLATGLALVLAACSKEAPPPATPAPSETALDQGFRSQVPKPLPSKPVQRPGAVTAQLGNGFSLWFLPSEARTLSLSIACRVGSRDNPQGQSGIAALTTRLLTEGTLKKNALELAVAAESLGTSLEQESGRDASSLELEVLPENEEQGIALLAEVVRSPAFKTDDLERVKKEWLDDLTTARENPNQLAWLLGYRALLGPRWGISPAGSPRDVRELTTKQLTEFYKQNWTPDRCALLAVGPTSLSSIEGIAAPLFGAWKPSRTGGRAPAPELAAPGRSSVFVFDRPGSVQSAVFMAGTASRKHDTGFEARQVLNNLFGGLFTSRLNQNLREKNGYTYGAFSTFVATRDFGMWVASSSVRSDVTLPALQEMRDEWKRLALPQAIDAAELTRAKTDLVFKSSANLEHTRELLSELQEIFVYELASDYYATLPAKLDALDHSSVSQQVKYVPGEGAVLTLVGDQKSLGDLSAFGQVRSVGLQWLDGGE